jgi:hypothetical protein
LEFRQTCGDDFELEIFPAAQAVGSSLDDSDLFIEVLDEAESYFVLRLVAGSDAVPMALDHGGELLVTIKLLPAQLRFPGIEESPRPTLAVVVPKLTEALLE